MVSAAAVLPDRCIKRCMNPAGAYRAELPAAAPLPPNLCLPWRPQTSYSLDVPGGPHLRSCEELLTPARAKVANFVEPQAVFNRRLLGKKLRLPCLYPSLVVARADKA